MLASSDRSREIGIFLRKGFQRAPGPWGDLRPPAEFGMPNVPSRSAPSPQDPCLGWARAPPPGREPPPLDPAKREAVSDAAAAQFEQFRRLREADRQQRPRPGRGRAELADAPRSPRRPAIGDAATTE